MAPSTSATRETRAAPQSRRRSTRRASASVGNAAAWTAWMAAPSPCSSGRIVVIGSSRRRKPGSLLTRQRLDEGPRHLLDGAPVERLVDDQHEPREVLAGAPHVDAAGAEGSLVFRTIDVLDVQL